MKPYVYKLIKPRKKLNNPKGKISPKMPRKSFRVNKGRNLLIVRNQDLRCQRGKQGGHRK